MNLTKPYTTLFNSCHIRAFVALKSCIAWLAFILCIAPAAQGQNTTPYQDLTHESKVFNHKKYYRLYLPAGYENSGKRYPAIYFFHGWGGRHFKDESAKLEYAMLQQLVDRYQVIMVMWDGNIAENEPRPYNVGNHEDVKFQIQMKDYFPELVGYIDQTYRTLADRDNRGIIGFSMGGFMSLFLSGKYPDMVCAGVSMMGSPEFFVGNPQSHTLYPVRYTFENLQDVKMRIHTSPTDILYFLNQEVKAGAAWEGQDVAFEEFPGGHMVDEAGKTERFETAMQFVSKEFGKKHPVPKQWSHYDLYGHFGLWGYEVKSAKTQPGFIYLKDVTEKGFGIYTKKWLPHGPIAETGAIHVTTAPVYKAHTIYQSAVYSAKTGKVTVGNVKADEKGRITLQFDAGGNEAGIVAAGDKPAWTYLDYQVTGKRSFKNGRNKLSVRLFNRGGDGGGNLRVVITAPNQDIELIDSVRTTEANAKERISNVPAFDIICLKKPPMHAEPVDVKLKITVYDGGHAASSLISIPVDFDVPYFTNIKIDDGKMVRNAALGKGNADGKVNAGEDVLLYEGDHRLRIYAEDPGINNSKEQFTDEMLPARWPDGFTQQSIIHIAPGAKEIECLASYETKTFNPIERKVTWGRVRLKVE
nr:alpha/beta fold hydrolase [uncultured Dyadobacter sp.]